MPGSKLTKDDLKECRIQLNEGIAILHHEKSKALQDKKIDVAKFLQLQSKELQLESKENELLIAIINLQLDELDTDVGDSPKDKIIAATDKLKKANEQLKKIKNFLDFLEDLINLFGSIVGAASKPSLVTISSLLDEIKKSG